MDIGFLLHYIIGTSPRLRAMAACIITYAAVCVLYDEAKYVRVESISYVFSGIVTSLCTRTWLNEKLAIFEYWQMFMIIALYAFVSENDIFVLYPQQRPVMIFALSALYAEIVYTSDTHLRSYLVALPGYFIALFVDIVWVQLTIFVVSYVLFAFYVYKIKTAL